MVNFELKKIVRPNIWNLTPYSCARTEFTGKASVFLDANENPYNAPYDRYPDPFQTAVKEKLSPIKKVGNEHICFGNGSDETIDLMYRIFCEPGKDNVVAIDPTYGMYKVCADINNVEYRPVKLGQNFEINADDMLSATDERTKIIWICSPNNPTGNLMDRNEIGKILERFSGIVVIDEAYIDFASKGSMVDELDKWPNLVILQTFSKAWASAGIRLGMALTSTEIVGLMNKVKYPYNINILTQEKAIDMLSKADQVKAWVKILLTERGKLRAVLEKFPFVEKIYKSDANFLLVKTTDANKVYDYLVSKGIIVRNRNNVSLCGGCIRISVGKPEENQELVEALEKFS